MVCSVCGRETEHNNANFCYYCGAGLKENGPEAIYIKRSEEAGGTKEESGPMSWFSVFFEDGMKDGGEHPVTFRQWLFLLLSVMIPYVGVFLYLAILLLLAFNGRAKRTLKNWARATLIWLILSLLLIASVMSQLMPILSGI